MNTKTLKKVILGSLLAAVIFLAGMQVSKGEEVPAEVPVVAVNDTAGIEVSTLIATDYYWRHDLQAEGTNAQTSVSLQQSGLDVNLWAFTPLEGTGLGDIGEIDLTVSKSFNTEHVDVTVGLIEYFFPTGGAENEREVFVVLEKDLPLSPYVAVYADLTRKGALYAEVGASHTVSTEHVDVTVGGDIGFQNGHYGDGSDNIQGVGAYVSLSKTFKGILAAITARYDENSEGEGDYWYGITLTKNF